MVALLYKKLPGIWVDSCAEGQSHKTYYKEKRKENRKFISKRKKTTLFFFSILFINIHVKHSSGNIMLIMFIYVRLSY